MENFYAIDFGGSYTTIYKLGDGLVLKEPSLIMAELTDNGYLVKAMGSDAKNTFGKTDEKSIVFCPISESVIKSVEYASDMLKYFLSKVYKKNLFKTTKFLMTYPIGLSQEEIEKYKTVAKNAGIENCYFVPRVICSAIGCDIDITSPSANLIVDIGGSSTDFAVISNSNVIYACTLAVGGKSVDNSIKQIIKERYNIDISLTMAEKIKVEIGSLFSDDIANMEVSGYDVVSSLPITTVIYANDIKDAMSPIIDEVARICATTLNMCSTDVVADVAEHGIYVCGAYVKTSGLKNYLSKKLSIAVNAEDSFSDACIIGAGKLISNVDLLNKIIQNI